MTADVAPGGSGRGSQGPQRSESGLWSVEPWQPRLQPRCLQQERELAPRGSTGAPRRARVESLARPWAQTKSSVNSSPRYCPFYFDFLKCIWSQLPFALR